MCSSVISTLRADSLTVAFMAKARAKRVGAAMRGRRAALGLTQREVAERIPSPSVTSAYISRWECGAVEPTGYLDEVAAALETTVADLMAVETPGRETPDLVRSLNGGVESRLARIEAKLDAALANANGAPAALTAQQIAALDALLDLAKAGPTPWKTGGAAGEASGEAAG